MPIFDPSTQHLDIHLPKHWNQCSTRQLEQIASVMREEAERANVFRPFSIQNVKTALFFLWSNITIIEPLNPRVPVEDQYYVCTHPDINGPFNLYLWQIDYWINGVIDHEKAAQASSGTSSTHSSTKHDKTSVNSGSAAIPKKVKGQLDWLDDPEGTGLTVTPYTALRLRKHYDDWRRFLPLGGFRGATFRGPEALMQNFSWQQYRFAQDYMDFYITQSNNLIKMKQRCKMFSPAQIAKKEKDVDLARALFLATIFNARVKYIDTDTQKAITDYHYTSNQHTDNAQYFRHFPEDKWQVILFWWSGMMRYLQRQFPHVFKSKSPTPNTHHPTPNPLEIYTATITTLEKYLHQTEEELNRKTFILTLETLERMSKENEELEKIRNKK